MALQLVQRGKSLGGSLDYFGDGDIAKVICRDRSLVLAAAVACAFYLTVSAASAQIVFTLTNVSLGVGNSSAGTLSGTFTTNSSVLTSSTQLLSWDIVATSTTGLTHNFTGFTYTPSNSTAYYNVGSSGLLTGFELDSPVGSTTSTQSDSIRFYFSTDLSATGAVTLNTTSPDISYESEHLSGGNRDVVGGSVLAAPEPSAWMLGFVAAGLIVGLRSRARGMNALLG